MKLGKPIQLIFCCAFLAGGITQNVCATEEQLKEIKAEIAALEETVAEIEKSEGNSSDIKSNISAAESEIAKTKEGLGDRESEIAEKEYLLSVYQSAFRVVTTLNRGAALGSLTMPDGSTLQNVVFVGISNGAVQLQTSTGLKTVPAGGLPASLASSIQLPPGIPKLVSNIELIYSQKPEAAMTEADKDSPSPMAKFASNTPAAPAQDPPANKVASDAPGTEAVTEPSDKPDYMKIKERNDVRLKKIQDLREEYTLVYAQLKKLKADRYKAQAGFNSSNIKTSKATQDSAFSGIDSRIDSTNTKILQLKNEMNRVRSEIE